MGVKCKLLIMGTTMFDTPIAIWTVLLVIIHSSKNKVVKFEDFAVILDEIYLTQMANNIQI